jgi:zinc transport system permease protein
MVEFLTAAGRYPFIQHALLAGVLASIACGIVGTYVVTRRITYIAGSISHCVLGGMGAARDFAATYRIEGLTPLHGAVAAALASALLIGWVSLSAGAQGGARGGKQREDTVIGALWAIGMAVGVLFIARTPGYNEDLMGYLFGNILMVSDRDLWLIVWLDAVVVAAGVLWYNQLLAVCFDEEYARLRGVNVRFFFLMLLCLTALTVVLLITVVGIVLVIALLTLPAAIAGHFSRTIWQMMALAAAFSAAFTVLGTGLSYGPNLPAGATIIVVAGAAYLLVVVGKAIAHALRPRNTSL